MNLFIALNEVFAISNKKKIPKIDRSIGIHSFEEIQSGKNKPPLFSCNF